MAEAIVTCLICDSFLDYLKTLPWCKQGEDVLIAVHTCTSEMVVAFGDHQVKVYPGGTHVKMNKSWLAYLQEKNEEHRPLPILLVWRQEGVELWYRRHNSWDFPYDMWQNTPAQAFEREQVWLPASHAGAKFASYRKDLLSAARQCPTQIPQQ